MPYPKWRRGGRIALLLLLSSLALQRTPPAVAASVGAAAQSPGTAASRQPSATADLEAREDADMAEGLIRWLRPAFEIPDNLEVDSSLIVAARDMYAAHIKRLRVLIPQWMAQERALATTPPLRAQLSRLMYVRLINEMALWSVDSTGPVQDDTLLQVLQQPRACLYQYPSVLAKKIDLIQVAPASSRPAMLAAEQELLARWGTHREHLPARPSMEALKEADQAIVQLRDGLPVKAEPMLPVLARGVLAKAYKPGEQDAWTQCAKNQWWLLTQLADGKTQRSEALTHYRYAMLKTIADWRPDAAKTASASKAASEASDGKPPYPSLGSKYHVQGTVTLHVAVDAQGKLLKATVGAREISVDGIRDNPPIAFETVLDAASLAYAARRGYPLGKAGSYIFQMQWRLTEEEAIDAD